MVPFPMLPTASAAERRLYEGFLEQLDDSHVVYHSVDWVIAGDGAPEEGEADFVIAHPELGVLVMEAKGGRIEYDASTRRWTQAGRSGVHGLGEDPFHQARDEMRSLVRILEAQPGWERWQPSYGYGVALPDGRYERAVHSEAPAEVVIARGDLHRLAERVAEVMGYWQRPGRRFGTEGMGALGLALGYRVEIRLPLRLRFDDEDKKIVELTDDQAWVLAFVANRKRAAITGPAGSGKTLLAVQIAKRLAERGNRTLLTCFNERLGDHLRELANGVGGLDVLPLRRLCAEMARDAGLAPSRAPIDPGSSSAERDRAEVLVEAARRLGPRYDALVVDQAQDFDESWWSAVLSLHRDPEDGMLYVFVDDNESLRAGAPPLPDDLRLGPMPHNLRSTKEIGEFVSVFYEGEQKPVVQGPNGRPVEILDYEDDDALVRLLGTVLRNLIEEEHLPIEEIAVLTPSETGKSRLRARGEAGGYRLSESVQPGTLLATSVRAFEGLERPVVILAELDAERVEDLRRYLYVGGSRARDHLIVLAAEPVARELRGLVGMSGR
jgi:hypothetical protein